MKRCLYLTYDGLLDPLGQSQILPYLERFATKGIPFTVVSFEKVERTKETEKAQVLHQRLAQQGIEWIPLRYHKWPPVLSTLFDLFQGLCVCTRVCRRRPPQLVHARSFVAGLLALWVKHLKRIPFLFDVRGFWPEERVEGGLWRPRGFLYRCAKWWERRFLRAADGMVVLSHVAKGLLEQRLEKDNPFAPIEVIPTCTDLHRFIPDPVNKNGLTRIVYVGSIGTWYLVREMVEFFQALQERLPEVRWTLLTPRDEPLLTNALRKVDRTSYEIRMLKHEEIPRVLQTAQASLCFIKPVGSKKASCPTKVGESLACGVPVVITRGIGDCDEIVQRERVGVVVTDLSLRGYREAIERLIALRVEGAALAQRCRRVAQDHFDLDRGVEKYLALYERLMNP
ncbi:MAG: glycosyltransferase family 4 protein [Candidatus Omnitrophica bacterium]|nr:glycosyltransferase family 4 protein [Candidatus Omnitrophota bacterium]